MNMHRMSYEPYVMLVFFALVLVTGVSTELKLTQEFVTKVINDTFIVVCNDPASRPLSWKGPRGVLSTKTHPSAKSERYGTKLEFNPIVEEDNGTYTCSAGKDKKDFHLDVQVPLMFMDTSPEQSGMEGTDITLRCEVKGGNAVWIVDGVNIRITDNKYKVIADGLVIKNANYLDSKTYICEAVQPRTGEVKDREIKLQVLHKPYFPFPHYAKQEQVWGYINGTVNLTCSVLAYPPPTFKWVKKSNSKEEIGRVFNISRNESVMQLRVDKTSFGDYKCIATNKYGKLEKIFTLERGEKPNPPDVILLNDANSNLLDIGIYGPDPSAEANSPRGMEAIGYNIQFRQLLKKNWDYDDFDISEENSYILQNLNHDSEYEVRVATRNVAGLSDYTNTSIFKTTSQADGVHANLPSFNVLIILFVTYYLPFW